LKPTEYSWLSRCARRSIPLSWTSSTNLDVFKQHLLLWLAYLGNSLQPPHATLAARLLPLIQYFHVGSRLDVRPDATATMAPADLCLSHGQGAGRLEELRNFGCVAGHQRSVRGYRGSSVHAVHHHVLHSGCKSRDLLIPLFGC
jgi:hypothetical protein